MDKPFWQAIINNDYMLPLQQSVSALTPELLTNLGSTDPEWREQSATILEKWFNQGYYSTTDLSHMVEQLSNNLTVGLGEQGTNTVLWRSFSALTLAEIVYYDCEHPCLTEGQLRHLLEDGLAYFLAERDLRGHEAGTGWMHAVTHGSDLLGVLALQLAELERSLYFHLVKTEQQPDVTTELLPKIQAALVPINAF